ncbi:hypothetical protein JW859_05335 [bacterium]|nr:hypothetical protein [bacterium]
MGQEDYFAPIKQAPREPSRKPPPWGLLLLILLICGGIAFAAVTVLNLQRRSAQEHTTQVQDAKRIPDAQVLCGEGVAWRQLYGIDWTVSEDQPRPVGIIGEFDGQPNDDILLIDLAGTTQILGINGERQDVEDAQWQAVSTFVSWDYDRNGIDDLVPTNALYHFQPKTTGYVTVRRRGG